MTNQVVSTWVLWLFIGAIVIMFPTLGTVFATSNYTELSLALITLSGISSLTAVAILVVHTNGERKRNREAAHKAILDDNRERVLEALQTHLGNTGTMFVCITSVLHGDALQSQYQQLEGEICKQLIDCRIRPILVTDPKIRQMVAEGPSKHPILSTIQDIAKQHSAKYLLSFVYGHDQPSRQKWILYGIQQQDDVLHHYASIPEPTGDNVVERILDAVILAPPIVSGRKSQSFISDSPELSGEDTEQPAEPTTTQQNDSTDKAPPPEPPLPPPLEQHGVFPIEDRSGLGT